MSPFGFRLSQRGNLFALKSFKQGVFEVQDAGSQLIASLCLVEPGMRVTDYCAGAGGKTLALAVQMANKGVLTAGDIIPPKIDELKKRLRRAGVDNVQTQIWPKMGRISGLSAIKISKMLCCLMLLVVGAVYGVVILMRNGCSQKNACKSFVPCNRIFWTKQPAL